VGILAIGPVRVKRRFTMPYTPVLATLGYVFSPDGSRVLLVHRNSRPEDAHFGKYNGLGGKVEAGEDVLAGMKREIREEAGIECETLRLAGTVSWPGFGKHGEDWFGFIFRIDRFTGTPLTANPEGSLEWVVVDEVLRLPLWDGDRYFLPFVFDRDGPQFHGVMPYSNGRPIAWSCSTIPKSR
jgi:8-oxo-dGTP diphosphatase